jgi:two-component system, OmpR family, response regulator
MTNAASRILVVDDEDNIAFLLETALGIAGHETARAATALEAMRAVDEFRPDLIVLDVMLPDDDGFSLLRRIRSRGSTVPVVFLSAREAIEDRVHGLTIGGDDYIVKPFAVAELIARVQLSLRRAGITAGPAAATLRCADLELDDDAHRVTRNGVAVPLSPTEYKLLRYLMLNAGRALTRAQILDNVWDYDFDGDSSVVDTFISYLRRKIDNVEPRLIQTIRGVGFSVREQ